MKKYTLVSRLNSVHHKSSAELQEPALGARTELETHTAGEPSEDIEGPWGLSRFPPPPLAPLTHCKLSGTRNSLQGNAVELKLKLQHVRTRHWYFFILVSVCHFYQCML